MSPHSESAPSRRPRPPGLPVVVIPCDHKIAGDFGFQSVNEKYIVAVAEGARALPLLVPVLEPAIPVDEILDHADGVLLTGSPSNVEPKHYGGTDPREGVLLDRRRDDTTLELIRRTIARGIPLFCICRGFQELNVAFGGSLHQHLQEVPGRMDHRADKTQSIDIQYGRAHSVSLVPGSQLAAWTGLGAIEVNSVHGQGVDRLAEGLALEAVARDGTIEAVRVKDARTFAYGVQWHPEWKFATDPVSRALFRAFGEAVRTRQSQPLDSPS